MWPMIDIKQSFFSLPVSYNNNKFLILLEIHKISGIGETSSAYMYGRLQEPRIHGQP